MLHPSTKRLLDRLAEMTRQRKIDWTETETGVAYQTEGYSVVLTGEPQSMQLLSRDGNVLEDVGADVIGATATEEGESYREIFASLAREASRLARGTESAIDDVLAGLGAAPDVAEPVMTPAANVQPVDDGQPGSLEDVADETQLAADAQPDFETVSEAEPADAPEPIAEPEVTEEPDVASAVADMADQVNAGEADPAERPQWSSPLSGMTSGGTFGNFDSVGEAEESVDEPADPAHAEQASEPETAPVEMAEEEPAPDPGPVYGATEAETPAEDTSEVTHDWGAPASSEAEPVTTETTEETPVSSWAQQPVEETPFEQVETDPSDAPAWAAAGRDEAPAAQDDPVEPESVVSAEEPTSVEEDSQREAPAGFVATGYEDEPLATDPVEPATQERSGSSYEQSDEPASDTVEKTAEKSGDWPTFGAATQTATEHVTEAAETTERVVIDATEDALEQVDDVAEAVDSSAETIGSAVDSGTSAVEETVRETSEAIEDMVSEADAEAAPVGEPPVSSNYGAFSLGQPEMPPATAPAPSPEEAVAGGVEEEPEEPESAPKPRPVTRFNPWN